jgi:hypothetical protein
MTRMPSSASSPTWRERTLGKRWGGPPSPPRFPLLHGITTQQSCVRSRPPTTPPREQTVPGPVLCQQMQASSRSSRHLLRYVSGVRYIGTFLCGVSRDCCMRFSNSWFFPPKKMALGSIDNTPEIRLPYTQTDWMK